MILSASRRTDIPSYYSEWFYQRIKEGFLYVRNPMNPHQISRINLSPEIVDCIVFWTKNPEPMLERIKELKHYNFYFQFTLTSYGNAIEQYVPHKKERMIPIFQSLADEIGSNKVIWRYDPILFTKDYTPQYHIKAFAQIAKALKGYTQKCVISFMDIYTKNKKRILELNCNTLDSVEIENFLKTMSKIASDNGMKIVSCAESVNLLEYGIEHNSCIDKNLIEEIIGCSLSVKKDKNQRAECGCIESVDVGAYNTCKNGCIYCYANGTKESIEKMIKEYDMYAPLLCGKITKEDKILQRDFKSLKEEQINIHYRRQMNDKTHKR